ncbi:hypothetical protein N8T08_003790 [Aspergillus melleus]|uniref:Uncharacterized protein n=1 Tax=Aspergillus melleus TaxID=138277 RepID=A0ACC3B6H5_9EURO|nr:hypothetical protein N8T08_003790 [Aspergillus melleus]
MVLYRGSLPRLQRDQSLCNRLLFKGKEACVANCNYIEEVECDENKHCSIGCCSKFGVCGLGPDYCGKKNCVSTCDAKSECDPGDWGSAYAESSKCPLNVCCSKYGFCGTTKEFCGNKKVRRPSCGKGHPISRVVGYYEGWSPNRPCNPFYPEQIPPNVYTHLNYAFATINPDTFEVGPVSKAEGALMKRLTALKRAQTSLRVNIAIGGWTFNDVGPTATTFSDIARSEANQKRFFKSLISFMATYGFDGVDIDWEYPAADDRSGRPEDFANFSKFMANLKAALKSTGGRNELSLTIPTSYWYLQHFDIKNLAKHVDYFNYMSYDLHGKWDKESKWTEAFLDAHSNLTEIRNVMDLLWRNSISSDKVVLGLPFYGRVFTMANENCKKPGCKFASAGNPGKCSKEAGVLMNSELDDIRTDKKIQPTLDKEAAVQVLTWGNQWVTYDDEKTLKSRLEFARTTCLGGVMVWAVSHDTYDAKYSNALAGITPYPLAMPGKADDTTVTIPQHKPQCRWTNCGQTCPPGFAAVSRSDPGFRQGELMLDSAGCDIGLHTLCCPKDGAPPRCGWYGHNNGKCSNGCPSVKSDHGSGDATCKPAKYGVTVGPFEYQQRSLCYNSKIDNMSWEGCDWYHSEDDAPYGKPSDYCVSSCPSGMVRLSMSDGGECLKPGGTRAFCCKDKSYVNKIERDPEMELWKTRLDNLLEAGTCPYIDELKPSTKSLVRAEKPTDDFAWMLWIFTRLLKDTIYSAKEEIEAASWDASVKGHGLGHLVMKELKSFLLKSGELLRNSPEDVAKDVLCRTSLWNRKVNGDEDPAGCHGNVCAEDVDPTLCVPDPEGDDDDEENEENSPEAGLVRRLLEKRREAKTYKVWCSSKNSWEENLKIMALGFPRQGKWGPATPQYQNALTWEDPNDCGNPNIRAQLKTTNDYNAEHILEIQLIPLFLQHLTKGTLISGKPATFTPVDCSVFLSSSRITNGIDMLNSKIMNAADYPHPRREKKLKELPATWIMEAVGSSWNRKNFYLLKEEVNGMKKRVFSGDSLVDSTKMNEFVVDTSDPSKALKEIKTAIGVWSYLNQGDVQKSFGAIFTDVKTAFQRVNKQCFATYTINLELHTAWDEWFRDMLGFQVQRSSQWIDSNIKKMTNVWLAMPQSKQRDLILGHLASLTQGRKAYVKYDTSETTFPKKTRDDPDSDDDTDSDDDMDTDSD